MQKIIYQENGVRFDISHLRWQEGVLSYFVTRVTRGENGDTSN